MYNIIYINMINARICPTRTDHVDIVTILSIKVEDIYTNLLTVKIYTSIIITYKWKQIVIQNIWMNDIDGAFVNSTMFVRTHTLILMSYTQNWTFIVKSVSLSEKSERNIS